MGVRSAEPELSIVVPVYNEELSLPETLRRLKAYLDLKGRPWEVVVVSDGSVDRTDTIASEAAAADPRVRHIRLERNRGKGAAVRQGVRASKGRYVLFTDADLSAPIKESEKLLERLIAGADVAVGSRALRSSGCDVRQTPKRYLAGRVFNVLVRSVLGLGIRDTQCGFKAFGRGAADRLFGAQTLEGFGFDVEVLYLARKYGMRVEEVPVMWSQGPRSRVRLWRDSVRMAADLVRIRRLHG
ncbi:MAG: Undecaprenyl-phosphate 4-deoxy-4-formamido-L-arabinose transferase [Candidatus Omnitrophica bacterium]|nr:Undecaprenyl-phosphate 4-deoxy-4-formamido-L-arabinose transferase [Candidatus Omnitrophota bacterium]